MPSPPWLISQQTAPSLHHFSNERFLNDWELMVRLIAITQPGLSDIGREQVWPVLFGQSIHYAA